MTVLRFGGRQIVNVDLSPPDAQEFLSRAVADRVLLEFDAPDGSVLVVDPEHVEILQDGERLAALMAR